MFGIWTLVRSKIGPGIAEIVFNAITFSNPEVSGMMVSKKTGYTLKESWH